MTRYPLLDKTHPFPHSKPCPNAIPAFAGAKHAYNLEGVDSFVEGTDMYSGELSMAQVLSLIEIDVK